ncbi:BgTH12-02290 [Blumeria graminis f. sp. triticale]|uniref:BgTH12-02290 n=1 Tax=Blumeria graminis f. sp. triticale TaxID=1689686 RepID=A0A9W4D158_BLUGR|nr:BgTH12-02290 [Blumeria graminis f. sp. triticale]
MRLYPAIIQPSSLHSVHLSLNAVFQPASVNYLKNVIKLFGQRITSSRHPGPISSPHLGLSPLIYHHMQPMHRNLIQHEIFEQLLRYDQFELEIIPRYVAIRGGFQIGFEYRHSIFEEIKSALFHWGGSCASASYTLFPTEDDRRGTFTFSPFHTNPGQDVRETRNSLRALNEILSRTGNKITAKSFILHETHTYSLDTNQDIRPIMEFHLGRPKSDVQARLAEMRKRARENTTILANNSEISASTSNEPRSNHKSQLDNIITSNMPARQVHIRRIGVPIKYKYTESLRKKYNQTIYHPKFLRRVKIQNSSRPAYRVIDFMLVHSPEPASTGPKKKPLRSIDMLSKTPDNVDLSRAPASSTRISRDEARELEIREQSRPLIRFSRVGRLVRYFHRDFDP